METDFIGVENATKEEVGVSLTGGGVLAKWK